jgi:lysine 2,3-aminomutase
MSMCSASGGEDSCHGEASLCVGDDEPPPIATTPSTIRTTTYRSKNWNDWRWQMANRIRTPQQLHAAFPCLAASFDPSSVTIKYPMAITPYYASLIRRADSTDPIFRMSVPQAQELIDPPFLSADPLEECRDMPVPGMVHRYPDRALVIATTTCSTYCRHCTRKRIAGTRETSITKRRLDQVVAYLAEHPQISDVIISGGDPLTMSTEQLETVLSRLRQVPSVQIIRIGTRVPVVLPQRVTDDLCQMLRKYHPVWINTHFNHPQELTAESAQACRRLADAGVPLGNQSVLLRGVNDDPRIIEQLCRGLVRMRVRPYYLYQCDLVRGVEHFRTPLSCGMEIMEYLRGRLSGLAIPTFVVDAPHGGGKIPVLPTYVVTQSPTHTVLRNYEGMLIAYPEPQQRFDSHCPAPREDSAPGVWELTAGQYSRIQPRETLRHARRQPCCASDESVRDF